MPVLGKPPSQPPIIPPLKLTTKPPPAAFFMPVYFQPHPQPHPQKDHSMAEPSSSAAGGFAVYKIALALGLPAGLAAVVVMLYIQPKSKREWAMALICTLVSSVCGGAAVVQHYGLLAWGENYTGLIALGGVIFACGLPGWVIIRAAFAWVEKRKGKDLAELIHDMKEST